MTRLALHSHPGGADHEARLARAAAAGNGRAFVTLYDRYEQRAFNLAFRISGSRDHAAHATRAAFLDALGALPHQSGAEPRFASCLFTATRNRSLEPIEERAGEVLDPAADPARAGRPEPTERAALDLALEAEQDQIRLAGLGLAAPQREILALGGLRELSYGEIAAIADTSDASVPELTARAWLSLHDGLWGTNLTSTTDLPEDCEQALPLIAMRDDGQLGDDEELGWLLEHLAHCGGCRVRLDAMQEAGAAYRAWEPAAPPAALFRDATAAAARSTGSDWSELMDEPGAKRSAGGTRRELGERHGPGRGGEARARLGSAMTAASASATDALDSGLVAASAAASGAWRRRPRRNRLVTVGLLLLMLFGLSGIWAGATLVLRANDRADPAVRSAAKWNAPIEEAPALVRRPARRPETVKRRGEAKQARQVPVVIRTRSVPAASPSKKRTRRARGPRLRPTPQAEAAPLPKPTPSPSPPTPKPAPPPPAPTLPEPPPSVCNDATGKPVPCPP